jgi:hypothetical protein
MLHGACTAAMRKLRCGDGTTGERQEWAVFVGRAEISVLPIVV